MGKQKNQILRKEVGELDRKDLGQCMWACLFKNSREDIHRAPWTGRHVSQSCRRK